MLASLPFDAETAATRMREAAGVGPHEVTGALRFATAFLGPRTVLVVSPEEVWGNGEATPDGLVLVRAGLEQAAQEFVIFHECAEIWVARAGLRFVDLRTKERACNSIAAALQAPPEAFRQAVDELGADAFCELAADFAATQTAMALRVGEVVELSVRVERPGLVRMRGPAYSWDSASTRRVELTDAPGRAAFIAA